MIRNFLRDISWKERKPIAKDLAGKKAGTNQIRVLGWRRCIEEMDDAT
jgi:hypothetical protein